MELLQKLRVDVNSPLWVINGPDDVDMLLPGIPIKEKLGKQKPVRQLMLFVRDSAMLHQYLPMIADYVAHDTLFWVCYPKKTGSISSDLVLMKTWEAVFNSGYRGQTSVSINNDWTGLRLTNAPRKNPSLAEKPMEERETEGIDYVNRTATLPADAKAVLSAHTGLIAFFDTMSFSHKREYMEALAQAKKPETRVRRIEKMVEMLLKLQEKKELKNKSKH